MTKYFVWIMFLLIPSVTAKAQSVYYPINQELYHTIDRYEIQSGKLSTGFFTSVKAYERKGVHEFLDSIRTDSTTFSKADRFNINYLRDDSWEWETSGTGNSRKSILKYFYTKRADFYSVSTKDFDLHLNPVIYAMIGKESGPGPNYNFINTRGIEVRANISNKIGLYTFMTDNQAIFPNYVRANIGAYDAVPGEAYYKINGTYGVDFLTARGYVTFKATDYIHFQFGHDKNFLGHGYRSLVLSDYAANNTFLKTNLRIWKLNYMALFNVLNAQVSFPGDTLYPKKYNAVHHISINIGKHFNLGIFESVIFGRADSTQQGSFDIGYLNPVIFYRYMEQHNGSYDNSTLGMDFKLNLLRRFSVYGQVMIDEFVIDQLKAGNGWWGNKQGYQAGVKYINVAGIKNLDLQLETNMVRPYTYAHKDLYTSYTHYNQPLAHPLGANFKEYIAIIRYQPIERLRVTLKTIVYRYGADSSFALTQTGVGQNYGSNPLKDYGAIAVANPYGQTTGQGLDTKVFYVSFTASYMLRHNLFIEFNQIFRKSESVLDALDLTTKFTSFTLRWNIPQRLQEF